MPKKIDDGGFVLVLPDDVKKQIPWAVRGIVEDIVDSINRIDWNKDNKRDVAQYFPFIVKALPFLIEFAKQMDWSAVLKFIVDRFSKNRVTAMAAADELLAVVQEAKEETNIA